MSLPFLEIFPREIRDLIYRYVLQSSRGKVTLTPWTIEVAHSLNLLRTCKQIHQECKAIIWHDNSLSIHPSIPSELSTTLASPQPRVRHVKFALEMLDTGELEWIASAAQALKGWKGLKTITLNATWEKINTLKEYETEMALRRYGQTVDGRTFMCDNSLLGRMTVNTGWPHFTHWGKQNWLREMLLDSSRVKELLAEIHKVLGGKMWIGSVLHRKDGMVVHEVDVNPRNCEVRIVLGIAPPR